MRTRIRLVGDLRAERGDATYCGSELASRKGRTLLALLAARPGHSHDTAAVVEALWPGAAPDHGEQTVASLVSRLRRLLGQEVISGGRGGYRLGAPPDVEVDLVEAARLAEEAERRSASGQPGLATAAAQAARTLLEDGVVLAGEDDAEWVRAAREEQALLLRRARHAVIDAGLATGDTAAARRAAEAAVAADPLDEHAARGLLTALAADGEVGAALAAYDRLRASLADELGADPAPATRQLHEAILRGEPAPTRGSRPRGSHRPALLGLAGRAAELGRLQEAWEDAAAGRGSVVLLAGPAGAGKTRLAEEIAAVARATGGDVLVVRCYEAEKALFLQPVVEAVAAAATTWPTAPVRAAATEHVGSLARLVPELRPLVGDPPRRPARPDVEHRRAIEAASAFLCGLARSVPLLVVLDDLHNAGWSTVELLHYLRTRLRTTRLLVVATVREGDGATVLDALEEVTTRIEVGPLTPAAVRELAATAGRPELGDEIARRTRGHALFVVEILRGLAAGTAVPESLQSAVQARIRGLGAPAEQVLRAGAVLGAAFDPRSAADLGGTAVTDALRYCEQAQDAGLLVAAGAHYEFANDVLREVVYATTPAPTRLAHHARAATLFADLPEQAAQHAEAVEDWPRAAHGWLRAAEQALERFAPTEAGTLAGRALEAAERCGDVELVARALLVRGRAAYTLGWYAPSWSDLEAAVRAARQAGDRRLEMITLREQSHDVHVALGRAPAESEAPMRECLRIARALGDRAHEADVLGRLTILAVSRLDFVRALGLAAQALDVGRAVGHGRALLHGLDATKAAYAYLGEAALLEPVIRELDPLVRADGDLLFLQWTVFESSVVPLVAGDGAAARARVEAALALNRRSGLTAMEPFFVGHLAWLHRLDGDLAAAAEAGTRALAAAREHPHAWWSATAAAIHATTLLAQGRPAEARGAVEPEVEGVDRPGAEAYLLRCLAALAAATGSTELLRRADELLEQITAPPGAAWLLGLDAYLNVAAAWRARGDDGRAGELLAPVRSAAVRVGWRAAAELAG